LAVGLENMLEFEVLGGKWQAYLTLMTIVIPD